MIVQGDSDNLSELLKDMMNKFQPPNAGRDDAESPSGLSVIPNNLELFSDPNETEEPTILKFNQIDAVKPLNQTSSLLEFFLTGLCRHLQLNAK